jgi:hypothetical protein
MKSDSAGVCHNTQAAKSIQHQHYQQLHLQSSSSHNTRLENKWLSRYHQLVEFRRSNGHCKVPFKYKHNKTLSAWVQIQRAHYKRGTLSNDRGKMLQDLGFEWQVKHPNWMNKYK